jgi:hypothetical protein
MMAQGHLGQEHQWPLLGTFTEQSRSVSMGMLNNIWVQVPVRLSDSDMVVAAYQNLIAAVQPGFKLALLKRQKFTASERERRIARSLEALNAEQPIDLPLAIWKEIVEEIEDED